MNHDLSPEKALDTAYRLLTRRPHTQAEIRRKLSRKGFPPETADAVVAELVQKGYINEDETALRWAQALVRDKLWGPLRIAAYLIQKGLGREQVELVLRAVWQEADEREVARRALAKRFSGEAAAAPVSKKASFLRARGFSADVIYKVVQAASREED